MVAVDDFDGVYFGEIGDGSPIQSAAGAVNVGGPIGVVDADEGVESMGLVEEAVDGVAGVGDAVVEEVFGAPDVGVAFHGGDFFSRDEEHLVVVELVLHHLVEVGLGVVVCDGEEVEALRGGGGEESRLRTGDVGAGLALAEGVGEAGVGVEIAFVPAGFWVEDGVVLGVELAGEVNANGEVAVCFGAYVVVADGKVPGTGNDGAGEIRAGCVDGREGEAGAAFATVALWIEEAGGEVCVLLGVGRGELDVHPLDAFGYGEGEELVLTELIGRDGAVKADGVVA